MDVRCRRYLFNISARIRDTRRPENRFPIIGHTTECRRFENSWRAGRTGQNRTVRVYVQLLLSFSSRSRFGRSVVCDRIILSLLLLRYDSLKNIKKKKKNVIIRTIIIVINCHSDSHSGATRSSLSHTRSTPAGLLLFANENLFAMYTSEYSNYVIIRGVQRRDYTRRNNRRKKTNKKKIRKKKIRQGYTSSIRSIDGRDFLCQINTHNTITPSGIRCLLMDVAVVVGPSKRQI